MDDSERTEKEALLNLKQVEIRFHIAKMLFILVAAALVSVYVGYRINQMKKEVLKDSANNRSLIRCTVTAFTAQHYNHSDEIITSCLKRTEQ